MVACYNFLLKGLAVIFLSFLGIFSAAALAATHLRAPSKSQPIVPGLVGKVNNKLDVSPIQASIQVIPPVIAKQMIGISWRKGCPVPLDKLAYLRLRYWGYDHKPHYGHMIINKKIANDTAALFAQLYRAHFPIQTIRIYSSYPIAKYALHNATVGFYCRPAQNDPSHFSRHAYGVAIDINPQVNPYLYQGTVWPHSSRRYLNRGGKAQGMVTVHSQAFVIFTQHGWQWGGLWHDSKDYMHFQKLYGHYYVVDKMHYIGKNERIVGLSGGS